jgi:hypothetical protein
MELIDRYIYAVGRRLPKKQREDIQKELQSLIMDELEAGSGGKEPAEEDIAAVLKKMGSPQEVAAKYTGRPQYLIGPELFPVYKIVAAIVFTVMSATLLITFIVNLLSGGGNVLMQFLAMLAQIVTGAASALGFITLAFAILERLIARGKMEDLAKEVKDDEDIQKAKEWFDKMKWDPEKLKPVPKKEDTVKPVEQIFSIAFTLIAIILFNGYSDKLNICFGLDGRCVPIFSAAALSAYLMWWNVAWVLGIGKDSLLLIRGRWELGTHIYDIVLSVLNIVILVLMLKGPFIVSQELLSAMGNTALAGLLRIGLRVAFGIGIFGTGVHVITKFKRVARESV